MSPARRCRGGRAHTCAYVDTRIPMTAIFERYHAASSRMDELIEMTPSPADSSREAVRERAVYRMGRLRRFLDRLGNPERGYPIVHIGGTSGKGSTSTTLSAILAKAGYRTGLHTSPYLQTPLEKLQINGALASAEAFVAIVDDFLDRKSTRLNSSHVKISYAVFCLKKKKKK